jgi:hypothetical protein
MRTMIVAFATFAFAMYAMAQATSNTDPTQNQTQQANQAPRAVQAPQANQAPQAPQAVQAPQATRAPQATTQPRAPVVNPGQTRSSQPPTLNRDVITQPNVATQPVLPNQPSTLRQPVRTGAADRTFDNNPAFLHNRTVFQQPLSLRERIAMRQILRGPDIGLWFGRPVRGGGLVISDIATTGPIARLGFLEGDRIVSVNGQPVLSEPDFTRLLLTGEANPAQVVVTRDGRNQSIVVDPTLFYQENLATTIEPLEQFGIVLDDRFDDRTVVWRVLPETPAFYAGFRPGDVITTAGGQSFTTRTQFERALAAMPAGEAVLRVRRGDRVRDLAVDVPAFQRAVPHVSARPVAPSDAGGVPNNDSQKINQPPDPAGPSLQGTPREPRTNR